MKDHSHRPPLPLLMWLIISLPIVLWDTLYVQMRPFTMPGGSLHSPVWTTYTIYARVDYVYGWPAWDNRLGFTAAQSTMNVPESALYCWYLYVVLRQVTDWSYGGIKRLEVRGRVMDLAVLLAFSAAVMTLSKSVLYCESPTCPRILSAASSNCVQGSTKPSQVSPVSDTIRCST